jgi:hypothetical protein
LETKIGDVGSLGRNQRKPAEGLTPELFLLRAKDKFELLILALGWHVLVVLCPIIRWSPFLEDLYENFSNCSS